MDSTDTQTQSSTRYGAFAFLIITLLVLLILILLVPTGLNLDSTMYLEVGRYLLEGRLPYVDYVELNPPLIHYINIIPVFLADLSGLNPIFVYKLMMFVIVLYSALITRHLILKLTGTPYSLDTNIISIIILIATIGTHVSDYTFSMFGQREHLLSLFVIPWIILRPIKATNKTLPVALSIMIGVFAAIGIALKPFFVLPLLAIEFYLLIKYRNWRVMFSPEVWSFAIVGILYLAHFFILPSAVRESFFNDLIPSVAEGYGAFSLGSLQYIIVYFLVFPGVLMPGIFPVIGLGLAIVIPRKQHSHITAFFIPYTLFAIGAIVAYLMQGIGFLYQALPFYFTAFIAIAIRLSPKSDADRRQTNDTKENRLHYLIIAFLIIFVTLYSGYTTLKKVDLEVDHIKDYVLNSSEAESSIFFVDTSLSPGFPLLLQIDRRSQMTYPVAFPIAFGLYQYENPETLYENNATLPEEIEAYLLILSEDIEKHQPTLILFKNEECGACPDDFDIYQMLLASGFIGSHIFPDYALDDRAIIGDFNFVIYKRQ